MKKYISLLILLLTIFTFLTAYSHPGRTDKNGGHYNRSTGEYHYHSGGYSENSSTSVSSKKRKETIERINRLMEDKETAENKEKFDEYEYEEYEEEEYEDSYIKQPADNDTAQKTEKTFFQELSAIFDEPSPLLLLALFLFVSLFFVSLLFYIGIFNDVSIKDELVIKLLILYLIISLILFTVLINDGFSVICTLVSIILPFFIWPLGIIFYACITYLSPLFEDLLFLILSLIDFFVDIFHLLTKFLFEFFRKHRTGLYIIGGIIIFIITFIVLNVLFGWII